MSTSYQPVDPVVPLEENPLKELKNYEVIILMDDSTSMYGARWEHVRDMFLFTIAGVGADCLCIRQRKL